MPQTARAVTPPNPQAANNTSVITRWLGAGHCRSHVARRDAEDVVIVLESDTRHPDDICGSDSAASAVEHLLHAVASSMATTLVRLAAQQDIEITQVVSHSQAIRPAITATCTAAPPLDSIHIEFKVKTSRRATDLERLCAEDPMYQVLRRALPVRYDITS